MQFRFGTSSFRFQELSNSGNLSLVYGTFGASHSEMFAFKSDGTTLITDLQLESVGTTVTSILTGAANNDKLVTQGYGDDNWGVGGTSVHSSLTNLDYASAAHTGFARTGGTNLFTGKQTTSFSSASNYVAEINNTNATGNGLLVQTSALGTNPILTVQTAASGDLFVVRANGDIKMSGIPSGSGSTILGYDVATKMLFTKTEASGGAPTNATYITQTANGTLTNEQALSSLSTGFMKSANGTGIVTTQSNISLTADVSGLLPSANINATLTGKSINGVTLETGGATTEFLNKNGAYSTPSPAGSVIKIEASIINGGTSSHNVGGGFIDTDNRYSVSNISAVLTSSNGTFIGIGKWVATATWDNGTPSVTYNTIYDSVPSNITWNPLILGNSLFFKTVNNTGSTVQLIISYYFSTDE